MSASAITVAQLLIGGILQGGFFALASVGLSLIFGVQRILNVAHGAFIVLASFITIQFSILITPVFHIDPLYSAALDFVLMALVGAASYFLLIYKVESTGFEAPLLATFGLSVFLEYVIANGLRFSFSSFHLTLIPVLDPSSGIGAQPQNQVYSSTSLLVGPILLQEPQLIAFIVAIAVIPLMHLFLTRTYYGKAIRATAQDWEAAEFSGIDVRMMRVLSFTLGSGLAGLAGGIFAFTNSVTPTTADTSLLPIILAVIILGGVGSMIGTLMAGLIVGLIMSGSDVVAYYVLTQFHFPTDFGLVLTFIIFLIALMIKPTGLFGHRLQK